MKNSLRYDAFIWLIVLIPAFIWEAVTSRSLQRRSMSGMIQEWRRKHNRFYTILLILVLGNLAAHFVVDTPVTIIKKGGNK